MYASDWFALFYSANTDSIKHTSHSILLRHTWFVYCILKFSSLDFIWKRTAYLHWHLPIKWLKNLIATKKQQELKFFMHQNSLPAPSLPGQPFSVANESCSDRKKQKKTVPHPLPPTTIDKLHSPHEIKSQTINWTALTIHNGSKTTPGFIWEGQMAISVYGGKNFYWKNVLKKFQMSEQNWGCLDKMSEVNFSPAETLFTQRCYGRQNVSRKSINH